MKRRRRVSGLLFEAVEPRLCLSAVTFVVQSIDCCAAEGVSSVDVGDLDGDGDLDVISSSTEDGKIAWYENIDGQGSFNDQRVIADVGWIPDNALALDLDGDGDLDVLASSYDTMIAWFENVDGRGTFSDERVITRISGKRVIHADDLNGDGNLDVIVASPYDNVINWYENVDGGDTFREHTIITSDSSNPRSVYTGDVDGDGDVDILCACESTVTWIENTDGQGAFGEHHVISNRLVDFRPSITAEDIDGDGDLDVLISSDGGVAWYDNIDGRGSFGNERLIGANSRSFDEVQAVDIDGDGDLDVLAADYGAGFVWYQNLDGSGTFSDETTVNEARGSQSVVAADVDGDGDLDVISAAYIYFAGLASSVSWYENLDGVGEFSDGLLLTTSARNTESIDLADLDGDGDLDLIATSVLDVNAKITWYENRDGNGTFGDQSIVDQRGANSIFAADIDGDNNLDLLALSYNNLVWYDNTNGQGLFSDELVIVDIEEKDRTRNPRVGDIDGDGDLDLLVSRNPRFGVGDALLVWHANIDGQGDFGEEHVIDPAGRFVGDLDLDLADMDGDGDLDVLASGRSSGVAWYENRDGRGAFGEPTLIGTIDGIVDFGDIDGDGDLDVVAAYRGMSWYENNEGRSTFDEHKVTSDDYFISLDMGDIDGDGDLDVIAVIIRDDRMVVWYENLDGHGHYGEPQAIVTDAYTGFPPLPILAGDIDGDGDLDIVAAIDGIHWLENRLIGDSNDDGTFNSSDLAAVLAAGKYEDGISDNATFDEGDWNQDGEFDSDDLIFALAAGHYEASPAPTNGVASAIDWLFSMDEYDKRGRVFVA